MAPIVNGRGYVKSGFALVAWFIFFTLYSALWPSYVIAASKEEAEEAAQDGQSLGNDAVLDMLITMFAVSDPETEKEWVDTGLTPDEQAEQLDALKALYDNPEGINGAAASNISDLQQGSDEASYAYNAGREAANNPIYQGMISEGGVEDDLAFAQTLGAYSSDTNPDLGEILTGCVNETNVGEDQTDTFFNSDIQYCRQARYIQTGLCDAKRDVKFVPVQTKPVVTINVITSSGDTGGGGGGDGNEDPTDPPGDVIIQKYSMTSETTNSSGCWENPDFVQCRNDADAAYQFCQESFNDCQAGSLQCEECDMNYTLDKMQCNGLCSTESGLTGTFELSGESIGQSSIEEDVNLLNGVVDIVRTPYPITLADNPADSFFVGNYTISIQSGDGSVEEIDLGNSVNMWDFVLSITLQNASGIQIFATVYEIETNAFTSENCPTDSINSMIDGFCTGTASCITELSCQNIDGVEVCTEGASSGVADLLAGWGSTGLSQGCWEANFDIQQCANNYSCELEGGCNCEGLSGTELEQCIQDLCWVDVHGNLICPNVNSPVSEWNNNLGDEGWVDDCEEQLANPKCVLLEDRPCDLSQEGSTTGECYERDILFECGEEVEFTREHGGVEDTTTCNAAISCMGEECVTQQDENNGDFQEAMIAASVANFGQGETECDDPTNPDTCRIFVGIDEWCKEPRGHHDDIGIIPDCCEMAREMAAQFSDMALYLRLISLGNKMELWETAGGYIADSQLGTAVGQSEWFQPISEGWSSVMETFGIDSGGSTSTFGSIFGTDVQGSAFEGAGQFVADMLYDALPDEMASNLFSTNAQGQVTGWGTGTLGQAAQFIAQALSVIMWIYMIYQFLKILANLIPGFKCEEEELQFGQKLVTKSCHYVGKKCAKKVWIGFTHTCVSDKRVYCCYNSPLARIINEQIKGISVPPSERASYTGPEWGDVNEPDCGGLSITEIKAVDWSQIDLTEWYAIMQEAGLIPDPDEFDAPRSWESSSIYIDDEAPDDYVWDNDIDQNLDILDDIVGDMNDGNPKCNPLTGENCEVPEDEPATDPPPSEPPPSEPPPSEPPPPEPICDPDNGDYEGCFDEPVCDIESGDFTGCINQ